MFLVHNAAMVFEGAKLTSDNLILETAICRLRTLDPRSGEVTGYFELPNNSQVPRGLPNLAIDGWVKLEVKLLSSQISSDGTRRYRFMAICPSVAIASLDMMMNPSKNPTILEEMMR
jgi:hypothetical protein